MAGFAGTIWSFAHDKLFPPLIKVFNTLMAVPNKVEEMKELERIEAYINDADRMAISIQDSNNTFGGIKTRVRKLREAAIRIEDAIEEYDMTYVEQQQQQLLPCDILADLIRPTLIRLLKAYEIENIKSSVNKISGSSSSSEGSQGVRRHDLREATRYIKESEVIGFEAPRKELEHWLFEEREKHTIIAVVGMGGLGKTALARTVYDKVHMHFDCYAWITVSESQNLEVLLRDMLEQFQKVPKTHNSTMAQKEGKAPQMDTSEMDRRVRLLIDEVRNYVETKRYVVMFDDVWDINFWSNIQHALVNTVKGSKELITTRNKEVAQICKGGGGSFVEIQELKPLSEEKSRELFSKKAFLNDRDGLCPQGFESISWKLVKKCEGLPLALLAIGSHLASQPRNLDEWQKFSGSLISELEKRPKSTGIMYILGLSYDVLPYRHKQCFLHFGIYPEDYEVESATLIRKWIAEGFVEYQNDKTFEEVAEQYLEYLINRSLVQVSSFRFDGKSKRCRVHGLLRLIILEKFKDSSFCHFVSEADQAGSRGMIRHLIFATNSNKMMVPIKRSYIKSVYIFRGVELPEDSVIKILTVYKLLRVLDFEHAPLHDVPKCWGNFFLLRYLSFRKTGIVSLPNSIGNLHSLETLDLRQTQVRLMPSEINKLRKLRHLLANHTTWCPDNGIQLMKEAIGGLESLQTLRQVEINHGGAELIRELEKLSQLRLLGLINVEQKYGKDLCSLILKMQKLEKLYVDSKFDEVMDLQHISDSPTLLRKLRIGGKLEGLPNWIPNLQNLVKLSLISSNLTYDQLLPLQNMPGLFLSLSAYECISLDFKVGNFGQLKKLSLKHLHNLNSINIGKGALQSLEVFVLKSIPQLMEVPFGINHLGKLEVFHTIDMQYEFRKATAKHDWITNHLCQVKVADSSRRDYWARKPHYS